MYDELMTLMNKSFEFEDNEEKGFLSLLPKLYKPVYDPCAQNYVVRTADGKLKAAVGAYDQTVSVCGTELKSRGIGNVCVIHEARHDGYMKLLMDMAIDDMIRDGIDFSALGGRRMRYRYFSFDVASAEYRFGFDKADLDHFFGRTEPTKFTFTEITSPDAPELDEMYALFKSQPFYSQRGDRVGFYDTLKTWRERIFIARDSETGRFAGYHSGHGCIFELTLVDEDDADDYLRCYMKSQGFNSIEVKLAYYRKKLAERFICYASGSELGNSENYTILNFKNVIAAFLKLAGTQAKLSDGAVKLLIHGRAGDENLYIEVKDGEVIVEITEKTPEYELSHFDAINTLFAAVSVSREKLPAVVQSWLPLPLYTQHVDAV
jgi:Predicted acetyltransferase involved in intracellular survival and related acetyltransferases